MQALLIIDVQNDFLPGGALAVPNGDEIIPIINDLQGKFDLVAASKDWHPPEHISFASRHGMQPGEVIHVSGVEQLLWPNHCVQDLPGAQFPEALQTEKIAFVLHKGMDPERDSYSAFFDSLGEKSELEGFLRKNNIEELYIVGLATDFCVKETVLDALRLGFHVHVVQEGCRGIGDEQAAYEEMERAGAVILPNLD